MGFGQVELFLHAVAQADAEPFTTPESDQRLSQLVAGTKLVGPRVGKGNQTRHTVGLGLNQNRHRSHRQHHHQGETEQPDPPEEQHRRCGAHHHDGGPEVRLHQQQTSHGQQHDERFEEPHPAFADFLLTAYQITGQVEHHEDFGDLGRLDVEEAEANPAHRAVNLTTDPGQQHHDQQTEGADQHQPAQTLPGSNRDHHGHDAGTEAEDQINKVANHVVERVAGLYRGDFRGRRCDHHQAKTEQRQTTGKHREVEVDTATGDDRRWVWLDDIREDHFKPSTAWANKCPRSS